MNKKIPIGVSIILILIAVALSSVISVYVCVGRYSDLITDLPERASMYSELQDVDELVRKEYFGKLDSEMVDNSLVQGYLAGLGDSYCYYVSPEYAEEYNNFVQGNLAGFGINVTYSSESSCLVISSVDADSPAAEKELKKGFLINIVNGEEVTEDNYKELAAELCNKYDGEVSFSYTKSAVTDGAVFSELRMQCGYDDKSCFYTINDDIGYISVVSYYPHTLEEFRSALEYMKSKSVAAIILDLRNSSGADIETAAEMIDIIVPVGNEGSRSVFTAKNEAGDIVKQYTSDSSSMNFRFAVIVNDRTECAAELIACDLRDFGKAVLVGSTTSGHGTLQKLFELDDGGAVYLTVAEIIPYLSSSFNDSGVEPDIISDASDSFIFKAGSFNFENDIQYQTALQYLKDN